MEKHGWISTVLKILVVILAWIGIIALFERCESNSKKKTPVVVKDNVSNSRYIVVDDSCTAHLPECITLRIKYHGGARIKYIDTIDLYREYIEWFCPVCIKEKEFQHIQRLMNVKNKKSIPGF